MEALGTNRLNMDVFILSCAHERDFVINYVTKLAS